jgi:hypothetical protein
MTSKSLRVGRATVFAGFVLALAGPAHTAEQDDETLNKVVELNKKALAQYEALDMEGAAALLTQALELCKGAHLDSHPTAARTHIHLGVVYVSGLKNREQGLAEFLLALALDARIKITKSLINPEVQAAFAEAQVAAATSETGTRQLPFPTGQEPRTRPPLAERVADEINHPIVTEAMRGKPIAIKAQIPPGLGAAKVMLAYRAEDGDAFLARYMVPVENAASWLQAKIPAEATQGKAVAYYIEAQDADDQALVHSGTPEEPHRIVLILEIAPDEKAAVVAPEPAKGGKNEIVEPGLWFVLAVGGGGGYYSGSPEMNREDTGTPLKAIRASGFGVARLLHLAPEIGFFYDDRLILSAQGRFQFVTGGQDVQVGQKTYEPPKMAFAGLLKVTWLMGNPNHGFQPFISAQAGAGQIRQSIHTPASANLTPGCGAGLACEDTVLGGVGLAGVGTGFTYKLNESVRAYAALTLLAGLPDFMLEADLNVGLAITR